MAEIFINNFGEALAVVEDGHKWSPAEITSLNGKIMIVKGVPARELLYVTENAYEKEITGPEGIINFRSKVFDSAAIVLNSKILSEAATSTTEKTAIINTMLVDSK